MTRCFILAAAAILGGCSASHATSECEGTVPASLEECVTGVFWADCGGDGPSALACSTYDGRCAWFLGGCVPSDHRTVDCPTGEPCCHPRGEGTWAFGADFVSSDPHGSARTAEDIATVGSFPISRDETDARWLPVSIDPTRTFPSPGVACEPGSGALICAASLRGPSVAASDGGVVVLLGGGFAARSVDLMIEIAAASDGRLRAMAFYRLPLDASPPDITCEHAQTPVGIVGGQIVLSSASLADPSLLHGEAELVLPDTTVIHVSF